MNGIKLRGLGRCVPAQSVTNDDLAKTVDTSDAWITARTGIRSRRRCTEETHTKLCVTAARRALAQAGITPADIGRLHRGHGFGGYHCTLRRLYAPAGVGNAGGHALL